MPATLERCAVRKIPSRLAVSLLALLCGCGNEAEQQLFFRHVVDLRSPGGADCCTDVAGLGDIDADGFLDVVIGSEGAYGAGLVWYQYPTWERHDIARGNFTTDGEVLDIDADGDQDVLIGDIDNGVTLFEHIDGEDGLGWRRHLLSPGYVHDLSVADLDGDGDNDIVLTNKEKLEVLVSRSGGYERRTLLERHGEGLDVADVDSDGDVDIVYSNHWLEQEDGAWIPRELAPSWPADTRIKVTDVDGDEQADIVLSASEGEGRVAWFERPANLDAGAWAMHEISAGGVIGAHSLQVADFDLDGDTDVLAAEMHTSPEKRILVFLNDSGSWQRVTLAEHGSHNMVAGDVDRDGDIDVVGKNYGGEGRFVEYWENRSADLAKVPPSGSDASLWTYAPIDSARPGPDALKFGLLAADADRDGDLDVTAGGTLYVNSGEGLNGEWSRVVLVPEGDIIHATAATVNGWRGFVAVADRSLFYISATDRSGKQWTASKVASLPPGGTQGWAAAPADEDGAEMLYFSHGTSLLAARIPPAGGGEWRVESIAERVQEEAIALGDLDSDGDLDIVAIDGDGKRILLLEATDGTYRARRVGASLRWIDRIALADIDSDGVTDIVYTEEFGDFEYNTRVAWLEAPEESPNGIWRPHVIATLRSANSLDVADMDGDGDQDVITAEHTDMSSASGAEDNFTGIFLNEGGEKWVLQTVEVGPHSSHLGAKALDLDGDGAAEIVSIGYRQACCVHGWTLASSGASAGQGG